MVEISEDFFVPLLDKDVHTFQGHTLLLPSVSVGNVPQLAIDLILNTLKLSRVGLINDDSLLPVVGNDALDYTRPSGCLHTGAEVYSSAAADLKLTVVQFRSPVSKGSVQRFCERLLSWCDKAGFDRVVILSSSHSHERLDNQITGSQFRFLNNAAGKETGEQLVSSYKWKMMEYKIENDDDLAAVLVRKPFLSGSGFTHQLHKHSDGFKFPFIVLNMFCSQGDNMPDAVTMATHLNEWLKLVTNERQGREFGVWIPPQSWSTVYGGPHPRTLY